MAREITFRQLKHYWPIYLFILPSAFLVALFSYYPAISAMKHAFYRWNGEDVNYFIGDRNFKRLLGNYWLWIIVFVMFFMTLFYSKKEEWKADLIRIISGLFFLVVALSLMASKNFAFAPLMPATSLNAILASGIFIWGSILVGVILFTSSENSSKWKYSLIPICMLAITVLRSLEFTAVFASMLTVLGLGFMLWLPKFSDRLPEVDSARTFHSFTALTLCMWALAKYGGGDSIFWGGFYVTIILIVFNIVKMLPSILTAVVINRLKSEEMNYWYRVLFVIPMIIPGMVYLLMWKFFYDPNIGIFNRILVHTRIMDLLVWLDNVLGWGGVFKAGAMPVWLGNESLVLPAFILWGFPWVGVVGVLIYLAGLQGIEKSVYEAADIDGASSLQKFFNIELPLILTQVRINMVLMIIGTLQAYSFVLVLFGTDGGPNGKLMIPGLYMFRSAFSQGYAGYACAIGLILFFFILLLTEFNNRYVKVDK